MTAESKQTHNDFETEQNDFEDFEIVERWKSISGWAEAVEVVLRVRITTVSWTSRRKKRRTSVDITITKAGTKLIVIPQGSMSLNSMLCRDYTQFIFEWPFLSDRFWVLVYILRKIVTNSLFFSKNNIQVLVSRTNFFTNFFLDTYFFKLARDYTLNLP